MAKWPESQNKVFNAYLEMAIAQGWADPVGLPNGAWPNYSAAVQQLRSRTNQPVSRTDRVAILSAEIG